MFARFGTRVVALMAGALVAAAGMPAATAAGDTSPPVLHSVSFSTAAAEPGSTATLILDASDDTAVTRSQVTLYEETSGYYQYVEDTSSPLEVQFPVTAAWANGTWRVFAIYLYDAAGNNSWYHVSGSYSSSPPGASTHTVDLSTPRFTVTGAADRSGPVIDSFATTVEATRAGDPSTFAWSVHDTESTLASMSLAWQSTEVGTWDTWDLPATPPSVGSASHVLPHAGRWTLAWVQVTDAHGNYARYLRDGRVDTAAPYGPHHDLDLAAMDLALAPGRQAVGLVARPGRLTLVRTPLASDAKVVSGYRVAVQPAGVVREVGVEELASGRLDLAGLPNGVTQSVTLTAHSAWGDSPAVTTTGRPVLSGNVTGVADVTGDRRPDVIAQRQFGLGQDAAVLSYPGNGAGGLRAPSTFLPSNQGGCGELAPGAGYTVADGAPLCRNDDLVALTRGGGGTVLGRRGWSVMRWVDGGFSLNADAYADVIAMNSKGELWFYAKTSTDRLLAPTRIGTGWNAMVSVISAGDLNGDRRNDITAVDAAGRLWLYPGNGKGGVTARRQIGSGWQNMAALLPLRDLSGDGKADLGGITMGGDLRLYRGTGTGGVRAGVVIGTGWQRYL